MQSQDPESILLAYFQAIETGFPETSNLQAFQYWAEASAGALRQLDDFLRSQQISHETEIDIMKRIKPQITGRLIYYLRLMEMEQTFPSFQDEKLHRYKLLKDEISGFIHCHLDLHTYYVMQSSHMDELLFVRAKETVSAADSTYFVFADPKTNTMASYRFSQFLAYDLLAAYIVDQTAILQNEGNDMPFVQWIGTQSEATEVIYALKEMGVFKDNPPIRLLKLVWEKAFHCSLGNIYKNHDNNRMRKKNRTAALDRAKMCLLRKYDHDDEFALG